MCLDWDKTVRGATRQATAPVRPSAWRLRYNLPMKKTCYACDQEATSKEHFPPKCFFPNRGKFLQLRTVPSCPKHNGNKSDDDLYVLTHICLNTSRNGSNLPAKRFFESVLPQLKHSQRLGAMLISARIYRKISGAGASAASTSDAFSRGSGAACED